MEFEDIQEEIHKRGIESEPWGSEEIKLLVFFLLIIFLILGYMCYRNYILISSGEMDRINRQSRRNKKNKIKWDLDEI